MKYTDIKHLVVETTNNLSAIPGGVIWEMLTEEWSHYLPGSGAPLALPHIEHPRIECITHIKFNHIDAYDWVSDYRLCTVLIDGKGAFFFAAREEYDVRPHLKTYVLDMDLVKVFLGLIVQLAIEASRSDSMYCAELVQESEEVYTYDPVEGRLSEGPALNN